MVTENSIKLEPLVIRSICLKLTFPFAWTELRSLK